MRIQLFNTYGSRSKYLNEMVSVCDISNGLNPLRKLHHSSERGSGEAACAQVPETERQDRGVEVEALYLDSSSSFHTFKKKIYLVIEVKILSLHVQYPQNISGCISKCFAFYLVILCTVY